MHWTEGGLCMRDGWLRADSYCCQFHLTNLFFSLNLWCKDLVPKKRKRKWSECVKCLGHGTVFMRWSESRLWTRDGCLRTDPQQGRFHPTNLFLSFNLWCKDLVPKKKKKEMQWVCWLFWPLDCLYALNREWTLCKRWVTKSWPTKESVLPN